MYTRYIGNTGKFYRVHDDEDEPRPSQRRASDAERESAAAAEVTAAATAAAETAAPRGMGLLGSLFGGGTRNKARGDPGGGFKLPFVLPFGLDISDVALLLIFLFLYLQSGDDEFLILLAAVALSDILK